MKNNTSDAPSDVAIVEPQRFEIIEFELGEFWYPGKLRKLNCWCHPP